MSLLFLLASFFLCQLFCFSLAICPRDQSLALVEFNQSFIVDASLTSYYCEFNYPPKSYPKTRSWILSRDCCSWDGVICDEISGNVIELDLNCSQLVGNIDSTSSLFQLTNLQRLDLSGNNFSHSYISPKFGRFSSLTHLDLSHSSFSGQIPSEISYLSKLQSLGLSGNFPLLLDDELRLAGHNFKLLLQNLTQLRGLDLNGVNISSTIPLNFSSHLTTLKLEGTGLTGIIPESIFHLSNLQVLYLGDNKDLSGSFPKTKWNSSASLVELFLDQVNFNGNFLPESLGYLTSLQFLMLDSCNLSGQIPTSLWNLTNIKYLILEYNHLEGSLPLFSSGLQNLFQLSLSINSLNGELPFWIFSLPSLGALDLSFNNFSGQLKDFKYHTIIEIRLGHNQLQGPLPKSIQNLVNLTSLDVPSNHFSGSVDVSFFSNLKKLWHLDLSFNSISLTNEEKNKSTLPESLAHLRLAACEVNELNFLRSARQLEQLDLSHNNLTHVDIGHIPFSNLYYIDLRSNKLQGSLPIPPTFVQYFLISNNNLSGEIPSSVCNLTALRVLDLAINNLKGAIPQCLGNMSDQLEVLDMQHNSLSGNLQTFSFGIKLKSFNLHGNDLEGKIPRSLADCRDLEVLDLGNNHLNDTFPMWLGTLPNLQVLSLRSNKLHGHIRTSSSTKLFPRLRMVDLSSNAFTEELPTSLFRNLKAMRRTDQTMKASGDTTQTYYQDSVTVVTKGLEFDVVRILSLYNTTDLSSNKFEGHIPSMMGDLIALRVLNLSHNGLQGHIPPSLGKLSAVESLDLSSNKLSGEIPKQLASLTSLAVIPDLRYVNISSTIPLNFSSHLTTLRLEGTGLNGIIPESIFHLSNLQVLNLEENNDLIGSFPKIKWNSSASLVELYLNKVNFYGNLLPESLGYLTSLQFLMLYSCNLSGQIPTSLWNLTNIKYLILENNHLEGSLPLFSSGLQNLFQLSLSNNSLNGELPFWIFSLPSLGALDLRFNNFSGQLKDFKYHTIIEIRLGHNQLQGPLPKSIQNLVNLTSLDVSSNHFSGSVDVSFFSNLKKLWFLDLSFNSISLTNEEKNKSTLPESLAHLRLAACEVNELNFLRSARQLEQLDLSHNNLTHIGHIPLSHLYYIDLRSNKLQGSLPIPPTFVEYFLISNNNLSGEIPSSVCNLTALRVLDLSRNNLKGAIPQCLGNKSDQLEVLDMQHNSLSGNLQTTFSFESKLKSFNLHGNKLEGIIPRSLANCRDLEVLDLGNNHLNDTFPMWLGTLPNLQVLSLRSNKLHGHIRTSSSTKLFPRLRMVDLSSNAFTEELPTSLFRNLKAMRRIDQTMKVSSDTTQTYYQDSVTVVTKGLEFKVVRILSLYTTMDLSSNKFEGHIPSMIGDPIALRVLNLSHNGLQGHIPPSLGKLSLVESLDLSSNKLSGEIPKQLTSLTSLAVLNLSRNHLEGCIPKGNQFDTFENNSYEGNDGLRGFPVSGSCGSNLIPETNNTTFGPDEESDSTFPEISWKAVLMGYGCGLIIGFIIAYFMLSSRNPNWLSGIAEDLEYRIIMRRRKKQQIQMHYR